MTRRLFLLSDTVPGAAVEVRCERCAGWFKYLDDSDDGMCELNPRITRDVQPDFGCASFTPAEATE